MHPAVLNYKITMRHNFIKLFIQLHVSTPYGHHQVGFLNMLQEVYMLHDGSKFSLLTVM